MFRKIILSITATLFAIAAQAQISPPGANDIMLGIARGDGTFQSRYIETDKTGAIQFLMFGQDPTPGAPVGQLRPQKRTLDASITCGALTSSTCGVNTSGMTIYAAQVIDSSAVGRSVMTAADAAAARLAIGAGTSTFDGTYAGLSGVPPTFAPSMHTQPSTTISDSTSAGRAILTAADASAIRGLINVASVSEVAATYFVKPAGTTAQYLRGDGSLGTRSPSYLTRALNTCYQVSASRDAVVSYSVEFTTVSTLTSGQGGTVFLELFADSGCTTGTQEVMRVSSSNTQSLGLSVTMTQIATGTLSGFVPAGGYVKQRTANTTGAPTYTARPGQEVLQ